MSDVTERLSAALADRYRIERELGQGGMATVYLAEDIKHKRRVALKVLKPELAAVLGAGRFVQEITTTAALQHPHILPLFDSGEADGFLFYVMPFIDGETLRAKLDRETQLGVDEAVKIASDVADALHYAHTRGVIHRDIKPENILLANGRPMVADFGIALALSAAAGGRMTETGLSLGTPHYMSPEQATAEKDISARSDIYSLASVCYEMLAGQPPHLGGSAQQIIMKIIAEPVEAVTRYRKSVPPNVAAALAKALEKLPADRFESAKAFSDALANPAFTVATGAGVVTRTGGGVSRLLFAATTAALALAVVALVTLLATRPRVLPRPTVVSTIELTDSIKLRGGSALSGRRLALSPDGTRLVIAGTADAGGRGARSGLWMRRLDGADASLLAKAGEATPFLSPDGARVGYLDLPRLFVVGLDGGVRFTSDSATGNGSAAFGPSGDVIYLGGGVIRKLPLNGGAATPVSTRDLATGEDLHLSPQPLPNGRGVIFVVAHASITDPNRYDVAVLDLRTGKHRIVAHGVSGAYSDGYLLVARADGVLTAAPFDQQTMTVTGPAVPLASGLRTRAFGGGEFALSNEGTMVYVAGEPAGNAITELIWVSRDGAVAPVDSSWHAEFDRATLSPDGRRLVASVVEGTASNLWVKSLAGGHASKVTFDPWANRNPQWTPDSKSVTYRRDDIIPFSLMRRRIDGQGAAETILREARSVSEGFVSPDGNWIIYRSTGVSAGNGDIMARRVGDSISIPLVNSPAAERQPALSPDGKWLAYASRGQVGFEVYVRPFPNVNDGVWRVGPGSDPAWSHSGKELFFVNDRNEMVAATIETRPGFSSRTQRVLFAMPAGVEPHASTIRYDVSADDRRFLMIRRDAAANAGKARERIVLITNWPGLLKAKAEQNP